MPFYIDKGCVGCQYCRWECPAGAITIKGPGYQIDADKCTDCGRCAEVCHPGIIKSTIPEPEPKPHKSVKLTCDVCVIGAGGVGTGSAARASALGMDVILIEAAKHFGGGTYLAHGGLFPGSEKVYGRLGIEPGYDMVVNRWKEISGGKIEDKDIDWLKSNIRVNGQFLDWFDSLDPAYCAGFTGGSPGFPFNFDMPVRHINTKARDDSIGPGWMGSYITEKLFETAMKKGTRYFNKTRALEFIKDKNNRITGVIAKDQGGSVQIDARAFVLGTGCYLMNDELLKTTEPDLIRGDATIVRLNVPTNVGDGHDMVAKIGGKVDYTRGCRPRGPTHHPYYYAVYKLQMYPENVFFNDEGERFFELSNRMQIPGGIPTGGNKEPEPGEMILHSRTGKCYIVMDSDQLDISGRKLIQNIMKGHDDFLVNWQQEIEEECSLETWPARKAESINDMAVKLGMDPNKLIASVKRYNELCKKGVDEDFGKKKEYMHPIVKPPFYGFLQQNFDNGANMGGISIDEKFRVIDKSDRPFENLYCAGDAASWDLGKVKSPVGLLGGLGGSWASGYQIANYINEYLKVIKI